MDTLRDRSADVLRSLVFRRLCIGVLCCVTLFGCLMSVVPSTPSTVLIQNDADISLLREYNLDEEEEDDYSGMGFGKVNITAAQERLARNFDLDAHMTRVEKMKENGKGRKKRLPDCILIGERKTGTTALLFFLMHHPQIRAPRREVHFFDLGRNLRKGLTWYVNQMQPTSKGEITFEKSPSYFRSIWAAERMHLVLPDVKLLLSVGDPIKRAISDFHFSKTAKWPSGFDKNKFETFEEYVLNGPGGDIDTDFRPLAHSLYSENLRHWLKYYKKEQIFVFDGGDITRRNPAYLLREIEEFLKLRPFFTPEMFYFDEDRKLWCLKDPGCIYFGGNPHPPIREVLTQRLREYFKPHNEEFSALTQKNFTW